MLRRLLPYGFKRVLWGDRQKYGRVPDPNDPEWIVWQEKSISDFYKNTQQKGVGNWVSHLAYPFISKLDFNYKKVLEIGPGWIRHLKFIKGEPLEYVICDIEERFLYDSKEILNKAKIPNAAVLLNFSHTNSLPFVDRSFDIIVSYNSLEHLYPLDNYLAEMARVLTRGGFLIGGIPCEGGLAWGVGRFLTTRRYVHRNYRINYDKIICWEHPNFADYILNRLNYYFRKKEIRCYPFSFLPIDFNLMICFVYCNAKI